MQPEGAAPVPRGSAAVPGSEPSAPSRQPDETTAPHRRARPLRLPARYETTASERRDEPSPRAARALDEPQPPRCSAEPVSCPTCEHTPTHPALPGAQT